MVDMFISEAAEDGFPRVHGRIEGLFADQIRVLPIARYGTIRQPNAVIRLHVVHPSFREIFPLRVGRNRHGSDGDNMCIL